MWGPTRVFYAFQHFGSKWPILDRRGPKWPIFEFSWKKQNRHFFTLPKTSIHAKNHGNPMCGFLEKRLHDRETERQTDRDETVLNGPNCPVGVGPKITILNSRLVFIHEIIKFQCTVLKRNAKKRHILGIFYHFGWKCPIFEFSWKNKNVTFFTLPKTSIHAKNQGNPMCGFLEKRLRDRETDRQREREREPRQYLMVRIARWASDQKSDYSD